MRNAFALVALVPLCACASLFQPGPDPIGISTQPPGAKVSLDGVPVGETPLQVTVTRKAGGLIRLEHDGHHPVEFRLGTRTNGTIALNIFWGIAGLFFIVGDLAGGNGSAWVSPSTIPLVPTTEPAPTEEQLAALTGKSVKKKPKHASVAKNPDDW